MLSTFVATEIEEAFSELFFGVQGGWIGFLLVASIMLLVTVKVKYAGIMFSVVSVMMGIMMAEHFAEQVVFDSNLWWCTVMYFLMPFFLILVMYKGGKSSF